MCHQDFSKLAQYKKTKVASSVDLSCIYNLDDEAWAGGCYLGIKVHYLLHYGEEFYSRYLGNCFKGLFWLHLWIVQGSCLLRYF